MEYFDGTYESKMTVVAVMCVQLTASVIDIIVIHFLCRYI